MRSSGLAFGALFAISTLACGSETGVCTIGPPGSRALVPCDSLTRDAAVVAPRDAGVGPRDALPDFDGGMRINDDAMIYPDALPAPDALPRPDALPAPDAAPLGPDSGINPNVYDVFDPTKVYLFGTVVEGSCGRDAIADVFAPNRASVGFGCYVEEDRAVIRPSNGRVLYTETFEDNIVEFHDDNSSAFNSLPDHSYPGMPTANDVALDPAPCMPRPGSTFGVLRFLVAPSGAVIHQCLTDDQRWYDEHGVLAFDFGRSSQDLVALGAGNTALVFSGHFTPTEFQIVDLSTSPPLVVATATMATSVGAIVQIGAVRTTATGFRLALHGTSSSSNAELWSVSLTGTATREAMYGAPPATAPSAGHDGRMDGAGNLYVMSSQIPGPFVDCVVQYPATGAPGRVVYSESTNPFVKIHISSLMTGP